MPLVPCGAPGSLRQHQVHDVRRHGVVAPRDVDLASGQQVAAVGLRFRTSRERGQVRACLRLGQAHRAGPFPRDELAEVLRLQFIGTVTIEREDRTLRQFGAQREGHVGARPHLVAGDGDRLRQALAAEVGIRGDARPAACAEPGIGVGELRRNLHRLVHDLHALAITEPVGRREHAAGKATGLFEHGLDRVRIDRRIRLQRRDVLEIGEVLDRETHLLQGGAVIGHGRLRRDRLCCATIHFALPGRVLPCQPGPRGYNRLLAARFG